MTQTILLLIGLATVSIMAIAFYWNDWVTKFTVLAFCVVLANSVYFALDGVKGWPAEEPTVVKGSLASVVIIGPTPDKPGAIYVGIFLNMPKNWYQYEYPRVAPKTFFVEYSNSRAAQFQKAKKALEEGKQVQINGIPPKEGGEQGEPYDGETTDFMKIINAVAAQLMSKQKDTYTPKHLDIVIEDQKTPPLKETN